MNQRSRLAFALLFAAAACGDSGTTPPAGNDAGAVDSGGSDGATGADMTATTFTAIVTSRDSSGMHGAINTVTTGTHALKTAIDTTLDGDTTVRTMGKSAYILDRTSGTLRVYDDSDWTKQPVEVSVGDSMHEAAKGSPEDIMPVAGSTKVYVAFFDNDAAHAIGVVDTASPTQGVTSWIALPLAPGDGDGQVEAWTMYACGGVIAVALQDLDKSTYANVGPGRVALLDAAKGTLSGVVQLAIENPGDLEPAAPGQCTLAMVAGGPLGIAPDKSSGVEIVDVAAGKSKGVAIDGAALQGAPAAVQAVSPTLAYAVVYFDLEMGFLSSAKVVAFDPSKGALLGDMSDAAGFVTFLKLTPDAQEIWFGVNDYSMTSGKLGGGLYVGTPDGKTKIPSTPVKLGQDPYALAFE